MFSYFFYKEVNQEKNIYKDLNTIVIIILKRIDKVFIPEYKKSLDIIDEVFDQAWVDSAENENLTLPAT